MGHLITGQRRVAVEVDEGDVGMLCGHRPNHHLEPGEEGFKGFQTLQFISIENHLLSPLRGLDSLVLMLKTLLVTCTSMKCKNIFDLIDELSFELLSQG